jgi:hypothetical protein
MKGGNNKLEKIKEIFDIFKNEDINDFLEVLRGREYDDLKIIKDWHNNDYKKDYINDYICYKITCEYGISINICDIDGRIYYQLFVSSDGKVETFLKQTGKGWTGIETKYYSNREEHYINGKLVPNNFNNNNKIIMDKIEEITKMILVDVDYPLLYNFIIDDNNNITLIPKEKLEIDLTLIFPNDENFIDKED